MNPERESNRQEAPWAPLSSLLSNFGLADLAASLSEAGKPLAPIFAQLLYIADPFLEDDRQKQRLDQLAATLEGHLPGEGEPSP